MTARLVLLALLGACVSEQQVGSLPGEPDAAPPPDTGVALACGEPMPCFAPLDDRVTVCGQLYDVATGVPLRAEDATGRFCDPLDPSAGGPCSVCANVFEIAELVADPSGARPLDSAAIEIDDCGRYRIVGALLPDDGSLAVMTGNCALPHEWTPVIATISAKRGQRVLDEPIHAAARATLDAWTESSAAPLEPGQSFADVGAYLVTYLYGDEPVAGVEVTVSGRPPLGAYYFSDDAGALRSIDPERHFTGAVGAALAVGTSFALHGGSGGEPEGCVWPGAPAASVPGALFVERKHARALDGGDVCWPSEFFGTDD